MIGRLHGEVVECTPGEVVLDVSGVGYRVRIPLSTYYDVAARRDDRAILHVHTHVREDALLLYGFSTVAERSAFERLIGISGVGPRLALSVLSGIEVEALERAVREDDRARLERIPGIGRKTAERILLELRSRSDAGTRPRRGRSAEPPETTRDGGGPEGGGVRQDAISALENLGYAADRAVRAVDAAIAAEPDPARLEAVLRQALRNLLR